MIHPEMDQPFLLAHEHHKQLLEEARRFRARSAEGRFVSRRRRGWRGIRFRVGELLVNMGQRLKADAVWS